MQQPESEDAKRLPIDLPSVTRVGYPWRRVFCILSVLLLAVVVLSIVKGAQEVEVSVPPRLVIRTIARHFPFLSAHIPPVREFWIESLVWDTRVPRALCGALVGMLLAMAGVAFQSLLRNPLADPYMVGVSAGSGLGSVTVYLLGAGSLLGGFMQPLAAFGAGLLAMALVYMLAHVRGRLSAQTFLLAGLVIGTFLWSLIQLVVILSINRHENGDAGGILLRLLGSLQTVSWREVALLLPFGLIGGALLLASWRELNIMTSGEESALHMGVDVESFKRKVILAGSLVTAATVSVAGIIAFVGFVVPHIARRLVGPDHRYLLPIAMLLGGIVLVASDLASRAYLGEMPLGVITSLIGAPAFCYLLRRDFVNRSA